MSIIETLEKLEQADFSKESKVEILKRLQRLTNLANQTNSNFFDESLEFFKSIAIDIPIDMQFTDEDFF